MAFEGMNCFSDACGACGVSNDSSLSSSSALLLVSGARPLLTLSAGVSLRLQADMLGNQSMMFISLCLACIALSVLSTQQSNALAAKLDPVEGQATALEHKQSKRLPDCSKHPSGKRLLSLSITT